MSSLLFAFIGPFLSFSDALVDSWAKRYRFNSVLLLGPSLCCFIIGRDPLRYTAPAA
jgi:hypothetical protein